MKNRKGFTLVELLAVIVIIGIVIGISIPAVTAVQKRLINQRVNTFYKMVGEAADAYIEEYSDDFDISSTCYDIPYKELITNELLTETDITCLRESHNNLEGIIQAKKVEGHNTFTYSYYLTCYDKETGKPLKESEAVPEGCQGVNGGYKISVLPVYEESNEPYYGEWTSKSIKYKLESKSPYYYPIRDFQYKVSGSFEWKNGTVIDGELGTGEIIIKADDSHKVIDTSIKMRSIDTNNNISSESGLFTIKIDTTPPIISADSSTYKKGNPGKWTATCIDYESGVVSDTSIVDVKKAGDTSVTCTNNTGLTSSETHNFKYSVCATGQNTCKYGCSTCGGEAYSCNCSDCYTKSNTCKPGYVYGPWSNYDACAVGRDAYDTDVNQCIECYNGVYKCRHRTKSYSNCATGSISCVKGCDTCHKPTYSCNCSDCYTGKDTCNKGYIW